MKKGLDDQDGARSAEFHLERDIGELMEWIKDTLSVNVGKLTGRERIEVFKRVDAISNALRMRIARLQGSADSSVIVNELLSVMAGDKVLLGGANRSSKINWDNLGQCLSHSSWGKYVQVLSNDGLTPENFGTVLSHFIVKGWSTQKQFIADCPVGQSIVTNLVNWERVRLRGVKKNTPMDWTEGRLVLLDWMKEQALARQK